MTEDERFMGLALKSIGLSTADIDGITVMGILLGDLYEKYLKEVIGLDTSAYPKYDIQIEGITYSVTMFPVEKLEDYYKWFRTICWPSLMKEYNEYEKNKKKETSKQVEPLRNLLDKYKK